jgi:hypothetical protein
MPVSEHVYLPKEFLFCFVAALLGTRLDRSTIFLSLVC